jgi:cytochrome P450
MIAFDRFPDQRRLLADRPELLDSAVEEVVRWWTPVHHFRRTATGDTVLGGRPVAAGEKLVLWFSAANRDPDVFADPHRMDITRQPNEHLAFGQGAHFCLGSHVARLELRITLSMLLDRLPDIALAGPPERARSNFVNAVKRLPVRFSPVA